MNSSVIQDIKYKSLLNQYFQSQKLGNITYDTKQIGGESHNPQFESTISIKKQKFTSKIFTSKKSAEEDVSEKVCIYLGLFNGAKPNSQVNMQKSQYISEQSANQNNVYQKIYVPIQKRIGPTFTKYDDFIKWINNDENAQMRLHLVLVDIENTIDIFWDVCTEYKDSTILIVQSLSTNLNILKEEKVYHAALFIAQSKAPETSKTALSIIIGSAIQTVASITVVTKAIFGQALKEILQDNRVNIKLYPN